MLTSINWRKLTECLLSGDVFINSSCLAMINMMIQMPNK